MNRRVLIFVLAALAVVAAAALFLIPGTAPDRGSDVARTPPVEVPRPTKPAPVPPEAESRVPVVTPRPAAPPRRAATPAAPEVAKPPADAPPAVEGAMLQIDVDVPDAQVFVDRVFIGKAPLTTTDVAVGAHRLNVSAPGYEGVSQPLDVKAGMQQVSVKLREVRLDASIDVIHKHRMGSCRGRLVATPRGLRYDTTDKDDAFSTALLDIDTFEVDYLEKNLRIKPRQGKRFDFTDPEGNADHLFVFHRDVEKARERLKKGDTPAGQ